jgi:hypothetical protein
MNFIKKLLLFPHVVEAIAASWDADTAYKYKWDRDNPSMNQCAVTALVLQDYFGGKLVRCQTVGGSTHCWNRFEFRFIGFEVDLTYEQFDIIDDEPIREECTVVNRENVLSFPDTKKRYEILKNRVAEYLGEL